MEKFSVYAENFSVYTERFSIYTDKFSIEIFSQSRQDLFVGFGVWCDCSKRYNRLFFSNSEKSSNFAAQTADSCALLCCRPRQRRCRFGRDGGMGGRG